MKTNQIILKHSYIFILFVVLLFQGCSSVKFISDYDEITDQTVTALQEKVTGYFLVVQRAIPIAPSEVIDEKYNSFFDDAKVDIATLKIRADVIEKNRIVKTQIESLGNSINDLEKAHKLGFNDIEVLEPLINSFNISFKAIIKLQSELKDGTK